MQLSVGVQPFHPPWQFLEVQCETTIQNTQITSNHFKPRTTGKGGDAEGGTTQQSTSKKASE